MNTRSFDPRCRLALAVLAAAGAVLALAPAPAGAALRSPHLTDSCQHNREYAEYVFGPWRVEGCTESVAPQEGESERRKFFGDVELNGMIVEGGSPLIATVTNGSQIDNRIRRDSAKLVLDPKIGGTRRRIVLYQGELDLSITTAYQHAPPHLRSPAAHRVSAADLPQVGTGGTVDLPVSGAPALLGLRVRDQIDDAEVSAGSGDDPGSITFKPPASLGATASALLRDCTGKITVKTVDGKGMTVDKLKFKVPDIDIVGVGRLEDLTIKYSAADDEWSGSIFLDLGEALFTLDLEMTVNASTGAPTRIAGKVDDLDIPIGNTGIFLQSINALFNNDPLVMGVGATATAGPEFAGLALIDIGGQLEVQLEPRFRLEANGDARVFPTGANSQLATGSMHIVIDEDGYISIGGNARYELLFADLGFSADIGGSGAYSTTSNVFNIEAHANGDAHLGFLGQINVAHFEAVISSDGWGTCGGVPGLFSFIQAGLGQDWDENPKLLLGCDLSPFETHVPGARGARAAAAGRAFRVARGTRTIAVEATADGPEPELSLVNPRGRVVAQSAPLGERRVGDHIGVIAPAGSSVQYFFVRDPRPGLWRVRAAGGGPQLTGLRTARDAARIKAGVDVRRVKGHPGRRRLVAKPISGLGKGETVSIGVRTPAGVMPLGTARGRTFKRTFDEVGGGRRAIVATVLRDGAPLPARTRVIAHYRAKLPSGPRRVVARRRGGRVVVLARKRRGSERPDAWQYVLQAPGRIVALKRARPGRPATFRVGRLAHPLVVTVRPVVSGRALRGKAKTVRVRRGRPR